MKHTFSTTMGERSCDHPCKDEHHSKEHPGFASVQAKIAKKEGVSKKAAGAILASASRHASSAAKKANPRLRKV